MMSRTSICLLYSDTKKRDLFFTIFVIHRMSLWKMKGFSFYYFLSCKTWVQRFAYAALFPSTEAATGGVSLKKSDLKNVTKLTGKRPCQNLYFDKVVGPGLQLY